MIYFNVYIKLDFPITHRNAEVFCKLESAYLHNTVNMEVFTVKSNKKKYQKGRALMQMYRVVPITKRESFVLGRTKGENYSQYPLHIKVFTK